MTWPGTHPDTEAGKPTDTGPNEPANTPPPNTKPPTNESSTTLTYDYPSGTQWVIAGPLPSTSADTIELQPSTPQPTSGTPDTDSPPSADPNTASENSSNTRENTGQPASDASGGSPRSATADLPPITEPRGTWTGSITFQGGDTWTCGPALNPTEQDYEDVHKRLAALHLATNDEPLRTALLWTVIYLEEEIVNGRIDHSMYAMARRVLMADEKASRST